MAVKKTTENRIDQKNTSDDSHYREAGDFSRHIIQIFFSCHPPPISLLLFSVVHLFPLLHYPVFCESFIGLDFNHPVHCGLVSRHCSAFRDKADFYTEAHTHPHTSCAIPCSVCVFSRHSVRHRGVDPFLSILFAFRCSFAHLLRALSVMWKCATNMHGHVLHHRAVCAHVAIDANAHCASGRHSATCSRNSAVGECNRIILVIGEIEREIY